MAERSYCAGYSFILKVVCMLKAARPRGIHCESKSEGGNFLLTLLMEISTLHINCAPVVFSLLSYVSPKIPMN